MKFIYIESEKDLENFLDKAKSSSELAVDLEFDRNSFGYGFKLCLIQIALNEDEIYLIDPFSISDLDKLWEILEDENITKIFHNASEDILLLKLSGARPKNIWDTEKAAMICNFERLGLSSILMDQYDILLEKKEQRTDWRKRPLDRAQLDYAALDVKHLFQLKNDLTQLLSDLDRLHWIEQEGESLEKLELKEDKGWKKIKGYSKLSPRGKKNAKHLYLLREEWAEKVDRPPYQVMHNLIVAELAERKPSIREWLNMKGIMSSYKNESAFKELMECYDFEMEEKERKEKRIRNRVLEENLKSIKTKVQEDFGVQCSKLIISQKVIDEMIKEKSDDFLKPYAKSIIHEAADDLGIKIQLS